MPVLFALVFTLILGVITLIPSSIGRKVIRQTSALITHTTSAPTPTIVPTTLPTVQSTPTASASPTLQIKPIIRRHDEKDSEE